MEIPPRQLRHRHYHLWNWALEDLTLWLREYQAWGLSDDREEGGGLHWETGPYKVKRPS